MKHRLLFALIMGLVTTSIISFVTITLNIGFNGRFLITWFRSWSVSH